MEEEEEEEDGWDGINIQVERNELEEMDFHVWDLNCM